MDEQDYHVCVTCDRMTWVRASAKNKDGLMSLQKLLIILDNILIYTIHVSKYSYRRNYVFDEKCVFIVQCSFSSIHTYFVKTHAFL